MRPYLYKAIDAGGVAIKGTIKREDIDSVYDYLSSKGLYTLDIREANKTLASIKAWDEARRIKRRDIIEFANNLSIMLKAGVPILTAVDDIGSIAENKYFRNIIRDIRAKINEGSSLSEAIKSYNVFPDIFVRLTGIGEETGRLEESLLDVAMHLQKMEDLAAALKNALIYPAFAIVATMGALFFWLLFVMPQVAAMMIDMGVELPLLTRILLHLSAFMQAYWYLILLLPFLLFFIIQILKRKEPARYYIDAAKIKLPIVKLVVYNKLLALFSENLRILIAAGITIDRSFGIVADVVGNEVFKRAILKTKDSVSSGSRISDALREHKVFPLLVVRMIDIGETSGNLDEQFTFLSNHYLKKLDDISQKMGKTIEPVVIVTIGLLFIIMIVGLLLPVYDLVVGIG